MKSIRALLGAVLLFCVSLVGFAETSRQLATGSEAPTSWYLQADEASGKVARLAVGMTENEVRILLGKPNRVRKGKKEKSNLSTFTYRRTILGPLKSAMIRMHRGYVRTSDPTRFIDTVTIEFNAQVLVSVSVDRNVAQITPGVPADLW